MNIVKDKRIFNSVKLINASSTTPLPLVYTPVTDDTTIVVPAGYLLEYLTFLNSTVNTATISCGTTVGSNDVFGTRAINGTGTNSGLTTIELNFISSISLSTNLYLNHDTPGDSWNNASLTVYLVIRKLV